MSEAPTSMTFDASAIIAPPEPVAPDPDDAIRAIVTRLARRGRSGDSVIERAAIMAEGPDSGAIIRWILAHAGQPEETAAAAPGRGLHGARMSTGGAQKHPPRYVLPADALA